MKIKEKQPAYVIEYPELLELCHKQEDVMWTEREIVVEKDLQDLHTNLSEAELHGVTTVLKLFTLYELHVGNEYWLDYVRKKFQRPEIQRMAALFGNVELSVHAPFYNKINEVLNLNTEEFYNSYADDPELADRMEWIESQFETKDELLALAIGSITEGAILYSNFAFLKHFQEGGKNKLKNLCSGINFSVRDENLHSIGGAWLFRQMKQEMIEEAAKDVGERTALEVVLEDLEQKIIHAAKTILAHESRIIDMIFEKGDIRGITDHQMKQFIKSRLNLCLEQLGYEKYFSVEYNPIGEWFYKNINSGTFHDFFDRQGNNYSRDWKETAFAW